MIGAQLRTRLQKGETIPMYTTHQTSATLCARLCELGADTVFLDCEHGTWTFEDVKISAHAARGAGGGAIVRPDSHQQSLIIRYLNAGADGIMVPMVNTAAEAKAVVAAVRYGCQTNYQDRLVIVMIETLEAIDHLDEMLEVEGVDVFFVGPGDLSQAMGHPAAVPPGGKRAPEVVEKVEFITKKIKAAGKIAGTLVTEDDVEHWTKAGMQFLYIHTDPFLRAGINRIKKIIKVT